MDFEELKVIWDSQNDRPLYAVDEEGLHATVRRQSHAFARRMFWRDAREIGTGLTAAACLLTFAWVLASWDEGRLRRLLGPEVDVSRGDALMMLAASALWLFYALYQFVGRKRQERRERDFEPTLRGDLDRTLAQTEYRIRMARGAVSWGVVPVGLATLLFAYVICKLVPTPPAVWLLAAIVIPLSFAVDAWVKRRPLQTELLAQKRELESLRRKLTEPERPT